MVSVDVAVPTVLSLASGGGGLDIGVNRALGGARTVCYVENEVTASAYLVASIRAGLLDDAPIWTDLKFFDARPWRGLVDGVIGGYPCQPFSVAGKRRGTDDPRHLWPYIADIVRAVEPRWCFFENVSGHLRLGFREVAEDLRAMGYRVAATLWRAEEVGAPHRRERLFILAMADGFSGELRHESGRGVGQGGASEAVSRNASQAVAHTERARWAQAELGRDIDAGAEPQAGSRGAVGDAHLTGLEGRRGAIGGSAYELPAWPPGPTSDAWRTIPERYWPATTEPAVRPVVDGLARTDLLRIYGNGVVPEQAAAAFR